jgi:hypothetical protein
MPIFLNGFWLLGLLPVLQPPIKAGGNLGWCLKFAEVPGARPEAHNSQFFWMGFWLLGLLPVFQPPMKAGAKSGEALKFAKVPGARPGGLNAQFFWMGFWLLGLLPVFQPPILRREQIRAGLWNLPRSIQSQAWQAWRPKCPFFLDGLLATGFATSFSAAH